MNKDTPKTDIKSKMNTNGEPITDEAGAHAVTTGLGAAGGAATGVLVGTAVGGPIGAVVGGVAGAVAGGVAGRAVGEAVKPTEGDGTHAMGTGLGAAGGTAAGVAVGTVLGGPIGAVVGGVAGAVAGGAAGHGVAGAVNPTVEDAYWQEHHVTSAARSHPYSDYQPAYRYGWESPARYAGRTWNEVEHDLEMGWQKAKGESRLAWNEAKTATREAWHRVSRMMPGESRS